MMAAPLSCFGMRLCDELILAHWQSLNVRQRFLTLTKGQNTHWSAVQGEKSEEVI